MRPTYTPIDISASPLQVAGMMEKDSAEHGSPRISYGDLAVDSGGNAFTIDRRATCYVHSSRELPTSLRLQDDAYRRGFAFLEATAYGVTIPAYNAWWRLSRAGVPTCDYGQTWWLYD